MGHKRHLIQHLKGGSEVVTVFCLDLAGLCRTLGAVADHPHCCFASSSLHGGSSSPVAPSAPSDLLLRFLQLLMRKGTSFSCRSHTAHHGRRAGGTEGEGRLYTVLVGPFASAGSSVSLLFPASCPLFPSLTACLAGFRPQHHIPKKQPHTVCIASIQTYVRSDSYNNSFRKIYSSFGCAWSLRLCRLSSSCGPRCRGSSSCRAGSGALRLQ